MNSNAVNGGRCLGRKRQGDVPTMIRHSQHEQPKPSAVRWRPTKESRYCIFKLLSVIPAVHGFALVWTVARGVAALVWYHNGMVWWSERRIFLVTVRSRVKYGGGTYQSSAFMVDRSKLTTNNMTVVVCRCNKIMIGARS